MFSVFSACDAWNILPNRNGNGQLWTPWTYGLPTPNLTELNNMAITCIATYVEQDNIHPCNDYLTPLPSGYRTMRSRGARISLIPAVIAALNNRPHWTGPSVDFTVVCHYRLLLCAVVRAFFEYSLTQLLYVLFCLRSTVLWKGTFPLRIIQFKCKSSC